MKERAVSFSQSFDTWVIYSGTVPLFELWYSPAEFLGFRLDTDRQAHRFDNDTEEEDEEASVGLLRWTQRGLEKFQRNRELAINVVLGGTGSKIKHSAENAESIARMYRDVALHARIVANSKGMRAERAVKGRHSTSFKSFPRRNSTGTSIPTRALIKRRSSLSVASTESQQCNRASTKYTAAREEVRHALLDVRRLGLFGTSHAPQSE